MDPGREPGNKKAGSVFCPLLVLFPTSRKRKISRRCFMKRQKAEPAHKEQGSDAEKRRRKT